MTEIIQAFQSILIPGTVFYMIMGTIVGIIFGSVPGLTVVMAMILFLPLTFVLDSVAGIALLIALYIGAVSGGLISAILLKIPGTPSSVATCFDGHPMCDKGQAGKALGIGTFFSFIGTLFSIGILIFVAPSLARVALKFGPFEYFGIAILSLTLVSSLAGEYLTKGLISMLVGFMAATVGVSNIDNIARYTFGIEELNVGFDILPVLIGLFAISEGLNAAFSVNRNPPPELKKQSFILKGFGFTFAEFKSQLWNFLRSATIGTAIGILPGIGGGASNIIAYSVAKNRSKYPEKFGTGIIDGIVASETANNATIGGAIIPLLTLGVPGDGATAVLLGGLMLKGIQPGPLLFTKQSALVYSIFAALVFCSIAMVTIQYAGLRIFIKILRIPRRFMLPVIIILCVVGAYGLSNRIIDVVAMLIFGVVGFVFNQYNFPAPPFILGFIIGPMCEVNFRRALVASRGNLMPLITRPISATFVVLTGIVLILIIVKNIRKYRKYKLQFEKQEENT
jgi:putative tricarboxylic transport membrane protein